MGLVYKTASQRATTVAAPVEPAKTPATPYQTWSYDAAFDPDSDEFFEDAVYEAVVSPANPPAPLSPIESASASSSSSGRDSPSDAEESIDSPLVLPSLLEASARLSGDALRRVRQDVASLTWLSRVPADAHEVPAAPRPAAASINTQRSRSISDAPNPQVQSHSPEWTYGTAGRGYALVPPPSQTREQTTDRAPHGYTRWGDDWGMPSTPPRSWTESAYTTTTPSAGVLPSPPSVTPRAFVYEHARHAQYLTTSQSPPLMTIPRAVSTVHPAF